MATTTTLTSGEWSVIALTVIAAIVVVREYWQMRAAKRIWAERRAELLSRRRRPAKP
jgi:hypothetical protein